MRRGSTLLVILASFLILCLLGLAGFVTILNRTEVVSDAAVPQTERETDHSVQMEEPDGTVISARHPYEESVGEPEHSFIFVGDSRTVGMRDALFQNGNTDSCSFIAKSGEGYYWLYHDGIVALEEALREEPYATVIFNLGVNDLKEADQYISFYKELFSVYHDPSFYIMSVNPVKDEKCSGASNAEIKEFNQKMQEEFPDQYLDCNGYLMEEGFESADGLHYSNDTYRMIHHFVVASLAEQG